jgi:DNA integrity scanning protein DisA with diadenylate cyclase activity
MSEGNYHDVGPGAAGLEGISADPTRAAIDILCREARKFITSSEKITRKTDDFMEKVDGFVENMDTTRESLEGQHRELVEKFDNVVARFKTNTELLKIAADSMIEINGYLINLGVAGTNLFEKLGTVLDSMDRVAGLIEADARARAAGTEAGDRDPGG